VFDLNGNGLEFLSSNDPANHVLFDFNGDGTLVNMAWAGPEDGMLVYDANHDHIVNNGSEIAFSGGATDLDGLRVTFDANSDNILDARDPSFHDFGIWQDADSDGVTDAGEFLPLGDVGIVGLNLIGSGEVRAVANGEVTIHGESTFVMNDGSTGVLGDVSLAVASSYLDIMLENAVQLPDGNGSETTTGSGLVATGDVMSLGYEPASEGESASSGDSGMPGENAAGFAMTSSEDANDEVPSIDNMLDTEQSEVPVVAAMDDTAYGPTDPADSGADMDFVATVQNAEVEDTPPAVTV
jgi:hypothetical protein